MRPAWSGTAWHPPQLAGEDRNGVLAETVVSDIGLWHPPQLAGEDRNITVDSDAILDYQGGTRCSWRVRIATLTTGVGAMLEARVAPAVAGG